MNLKPSTSISATYKAVYKIDYENELNPAQLQAVTFDQGPLLVIAGAGSGKTRTLTYRVARLVENGVPPSSILLLSFTRKAAQEMLKRAAQLLDNRCQHVSGGTFHSFANGILRRYAAHIGFDNGFSILDRSDSEDLIGLICKEFTSNTEGKSLPRKATLANIFSRSVNKSLPLEEVIYEDYPHFGFMLDTIDKIWTIYQKKKQEHYFCDYDDLLIYLYQLLNTNNALREQIAAAYQYILVDEYQDTNQIQADIISLLAYSHQNIMVVGDDSQSIYAFRGANFKNIISFPERFPGTCVTKLEENYRSLQPILDLTNSLIEQASEKYSKHLFTRQSGGRVPVLAATTDENTQSRYVTDQLLRLQKQGTPIDQMAVLFRAGFHSFDLEIELARAGIDFIKVGGFKFTESAHIKDVLAHIKIFAAPRDRLSWYRVLLLVEHIGPKTAKQIYDAIITEGGGASGLLSVPLKSKIASTLTPLKEMITSADAFTLSVSQLGEIVLDYYLPLLKKRYDDHPRRTKDLQQLITIMERYESLDDFLSDMALEPPNTSVKDRLNVTEDNAGRLTLSTIHSAKGLEWHSVFVIWALDGRFPSHHAIDRAADLEEERRLMYVATTRARENLFITYPCQAYDRTTGTMLYRPSRFLEDIPDNLLDHQFYVPQDDW